MCNQSLVNIDSTNIVRLKACIGSCLVYRWKDNSRCDLQHRRLMHCAGLREKQAYTQPITFHKPYVYNNLRITTYVFTHSNYVILRHYIFLCNIKIWCIFMYHTYICFATYARQALFDDYIAHSSAPFPSKCQTCHLTCGV